MKTALCVLFSFVFFVFSAKAVEVTNLRVPSLEKKWIEYEIQTGDTVYGIMRKIGKDPANLKHRPLLDEFYQLNPLIVRQQTVLEPEQWLRLPVKELPKSKDYKIVDGNVLVFAEVKPEIKPVKKATKPNLTNMEKKNFKLRPDGFFTMRIHQDDPIAKPAVEMLESHGFIPRWGKDGYLINAHYQTGALSKAAPSIVEEKSQPTLFGLRLGALAGLSSIDVTDNSSLRAQLNQTIESGISLGGDYSWGFNKVFLNSNATFFTTSDPNTTPVSTEGALVFSGELGYQRQFGGWSASLSGGYFQDRFVIGDTTSILMRTAGFVFAQIAASFDLGMVWGGRLNVGPMYQNIFEGTHFNNTFSGAKYSALVQYQIGVFDINLEGGIKQWTSSLLKQDQTFIKIGFEWGWDL